MRVNDLDKKYKKNIKIWKEKKRKRDAKREDEWEIEREQKYEHVNF